MGVGFAFHLGTNLEAPLAVQLINCVELITSARMDDKGQIAGLYQQIALSASATAVLYEKLKCHNLR